MAKLSPDLVAAGSFLTLMSEGEAVTFQTFGEPRKNSALNRVLHGTLEQHVAELDALNGAGAGVFWMVNIGDGKGRAAANVTGIRALFLDLDGAPLEPVFSTGLTPHAVVETSPGRWHVYWLTGDCPIARFKPLQQALARRWGGDKTVSDTPRVMRLPGFWHQKGDPFLSRCVNLEPLQPYPLKEIIARLDLRPEERGLAGQPKQERSAVAFAEGDRNAGLTQIAGSMRRKGLSGGAIEAALLVENQARCKPPLDDEEVRRIAASVSRYEPVRAVGPDHPMAANEASPEAWPDPVLPGAIQTPEIPASLLPGWVGGMVGAVATWSQTPVVVSVMMALSVLAAALQRRFEVAPWGDDYREPLALWTLTALPSGSRKTAVINKLADPLVRWEKREQDRMRPEIARVFAMREIATKRIEKLKFDAAKTENAEERTAIQDMIQREREEMPAERFTPRIFTGDVTGERLQQLLVEQDERMTVLTDEGGIFGIMAGQYSGGVASLDVFLQGHSGSPMRIDRAGRFAHLDRPALSFGLALQPGVLAEVGKSRRFHESGLLGRFLYAIPKSNVGLRDVRARNSISPEVSNAWQENVFGLLENIRRPIGKPVVLTLSDAARERWLNFSEEIEANQGEGKRWDHISSWTGKLPGAAARISALLELAAQGTASTAVSEDSMRRAVDLCGLLAVHAEAAFRLMGAMDVEADAFALLRWIQTHRFYEFTRHECHKAMEGRFRNLERMLGALRVLHEWYVVSGAMVRANPRARSTTFYRVNPKLFIDKSS